MSDNTAIEWTDATWNPVSGCDEVSPGCDHCYAKTLAERFRGTPGHYYENGFDVQLRQDKLFQPLRWQRGRRIFVNSMSDLFHDQIPDDYVTKVFAVMGLARRHTFQLLTKRHGRMRSLLSSPTFRLAVQDEMQAMLGRTDTPIGRGRKWLLTGNAEAWMPYTVWPLPNVWLGVSVENQQWADIRVPALLQTPAAVRWLSCEPLLGPVDLIRAVDKLDWLDPAQFEPGGIEWVVAGGESGRNARPMHPSWARALRDDCVLHGVPFLFKQWGEWAPPASEPTDAEADRHKAICLQLDGQITPWDQEPAGTSAATMLRLGKKTAGRELDDRTWDEYPTAVPA